tara:strand:- start:207 stop:620 length:414 start_codon:yes stop_codon:yes gene_type:complete
MLTIVPIYAGIFGFMMIALSVRVIRLRRREKIALGCAPQSDLERAIRVQSNFAEYVPLALLLVAFIEFGGGPAWLLHGLCGILLAGRAAHAIGVSRAPENFGFRVAGMVSTFFVLATASMNLLSGGGLFATLIDSIV